MCLPHGFLMILTQFKGDFGEADTDVRSLPFLPRQLFHHR
jgi:hypothetical protein